MGLNQYSTAEGFFDCVAPLVTAEMRRFFSWKGRLLSLVIFLEKLGLLPFALLLKVYKTLARVCALVFSALFLLLTLFSSPATRLLFVRRVEALAQDVADWVLWPAAVIVCLGRLLLAAFVHPILYF